MGSEERGLTQAVDQNRLTDLVWSGRIESPILAHPEALFSVYTFKAIPDNVRDTILQFADRNKENLGNVINRWNLSVERKKDIELSDITHGALVVAIAESYGEDSLDEAKYRKRLIIQAARVHRQERNYT